MFVKHQRTYSHSTNATAQLDEKIQARHQERLTFEPLPLNMSFVGSNAIASLTIDVCDVDVAMVLHGILESNQCRSTYYRKDVLVAPDQPFVRASGTHPCTTPS